MPEEQFTPEVLWAQRSSSTDPDRNYVYLTISAPDVSPDNLKVDLKPTGLTFTGHSLTQKKTYHVSLEFYEEIDVKESQTHHSPRDVEFKLRKKELKADYWPRLLKESKKMHFLKTDFDKWVDEDEQDGAAEEDFGGMGGGMGGMPDMGAMGGDGGFGGIDFSKLGGAGGMPDMGDLGDEGAEEEDEDEEMPSLEGDEAAEEGDAAAAAATGKGKAKVSEVEPAAAAAAEGKPSSKIEELS